MAGIGLGSCSDGSPLVGGGSGVTFQQENSSFGVGTEFVALVCDLRYLDMSLQVPVQLISELSCCVVKRKSFNGMRMKTQSRDHVRSHGKIHDH